jgi:transcriptional/translational regulatory protein YebC/TACO1
LQSCLQHAKSVQLPKERIEEAIQKGTSKGNAGSEDLVTLRFDAIVNMDSTKVACVITALSDNRNRTTKHVRHIVSKSNGELLPTEKLAYLFVQVGWIIVELLVDQEEDEDAFLDCALEAGAINVEEFDMMEDEEDTSSRSKNATTITFLVTTDEKDLWRVVTSLRDAGYPVVEFEHRYILQDSEHGGVELSKQGEEDLEAFLEKMDENEDVNNVYHNAA